MERSAEWLRGAAHAAAECKQFKAAVWYQMLLAEAEAREASEAKAAPMEEALTACYKDHPLYSEASVPTAADLAVADELDMLAAHIQEYIGPDDARDDIRRICRNRAEDLRRGVKRGPTAAEVIEAAKKALRCGKWESFTPDEREMLADALAKIAAWEAARG